MSQDKEGVIKPIFSLNSIFTKYVVTALCLCRAEYLYGRAFTIYTDHKPLMSLFSEIRCIPPLASARIQRWALTLSAYQYTIVYRAGKDNTNADALSRLPLPDTPADTFVPPETVFSLERLAELPIKGQAVDREGPSAIPN